MCMHNMFYTSTYTNHIWVFINKQLLLLTVKRLGAMSQAEQWDTVNKRMHWKAKQKCWPKKRKKETTSLGMEQTVSYGRARRARRGSSQGRLPLCFSGSFPQSPARHWYKRWQSYCSTHPFVMWLSHFNLKSVMFKSKILQWVIYNDCWNISM